MHKKYASKQSYYMRQHWDNSLISFYPCPRGHKSVSTTYDKITPFYCNTCKAYYDIRGIFLNT